MASCSRCAAGLVGRVWLRGHFDPKLHCFEENLVGRIKFECRSE